MENESDPIDAARRAGFDIDLIDTNLSLTLEERLRQHDAALTVIFDLQQAWRNRDAELQRTARATG